MPNYTGIEISDLTPSFLKGDEGDAGEPGKDGLSAYKVAIQNGFTGTEQEWLESLNGKDGESAYELAVQKRF